MINARKELVTVSMLRTWRVFSNDDLKHTKLYGVLLNVFTFLSSEDGNGLLECCLLAKE